MQVGGCNLWFVDASTMALWARRDSSKLVGYPQLLYVEGEPPTAGMATVRNGDEEERPLIHMHSSIVRKHYAPVEVDGIRGLVEIALGID